MIQAPLETVFAALTDAGQMARWQHGRRVETDWTPGGPIRFFTPASGEVAALEQSGRLLDFVPGQLIRYRLCTPRQGARPAVETVTSYLLAPHADGVQVTLIQEDDRVSGWGPVSLAPILQALGRFCQSGRDG